jgi:hypothetical protein
MSRKKQPKAGPIEHIVVGAVEPGGLVSYAVPGEVAIALNTGRSQFINGLVNRVRKGQVIDPVQVIGMLELIRDWTDAKYADDRRNTIIRENLAASRTSLIELQGQVGELTRRISDTVAAATRVAHLHGSGPLGTEDDLE